MFLRKFFALIRRVRLLIRSKILRQYFQFAFPGLVCASSAQFGPRVRIRAFDGGRIEIGDNCFIHEDTLIIADGGLLRIEGESQISRGSVIVSKAQIIIGKGTQIAEYVSIRDHDHQWQGDAPLAAQGFSSAPVIIGHDVWLAAKVTVTKGVTIAPQSVVGANSVVTRSLETRGAYAGAPARLLSAARGREKP